MDGLIFGGAFLRREICVSKSIGLALLLEVNLPFLFCFSLYLRAILQVQAPGGLYLEGRFNGGFFALPDWGTYIWRGLYMEGLIFGILRYISLATSVKMARYSFSGSIPPKFKQKPHRHKQRFGIITHNRHHSCIR